MKPSHSKKDADQTAGDPELDFDDLELVMSEEEEFDDLEAVPADDEDLLEEWTADDEDVQITVSSAAEEAFDLRLLVAVGSLEKSQILAAVTAPLQTKVDQVAAQLRSQRVVVTFSGESMIPSGIKDLVAALLADSCPVAVTVQRGYPDELVYTGEAPRVEVSRTKIEATDEAPAQVCLDVGTGGIEEEDLPMALSTELESLCQDAKGQAFAFSFNGGPSPSPDVYCAPLIEAGASRIVLSSAGGDQVLYDRELEGLVTVSETDGQTNVEVAEGCDLATAQRACSLVLTQNDQHITGKRVTVRLPAAISKSEFADFLLAVAKELKPASLTFGDGDSLWPPVLQAATKGKRTGLRLRDGVKPDLARSVRRELTEISIAGQEVVFDWPEGTTPDPEVAAVLIDASPVALVFTVGRENGELIHPVPVAFRTEADILICEIETSIGKPAELVPAIERLMSARSMSGQKVDLCIKGDGMLTRTMRATMIAALEAGGATQGRLTEQGQTEFLFPDLLGFESVGEDQVRLSVSPGDRSPEQVASAFASELEARQLAAGTTVRVADESLLAELIEQGVSRIVVEGDTVVQVHPTLFQGVSSEGDQLTIRATPDAEDLMAQLDREFDAVLAELGQLSEATVTLCWVGESAARAQALERILAAGPAVLRLDEDGVVVQLHPEIVRSHVDVLGQRTTGDLPMIMLGIDTDDVEGAAGALGALQSELEGRRVLVVYRDGDREVAGAADNPVVESTRAVLDAAARVVLQFRPKTRSRSAYFEIVKSNLESLVVGTRVKDPRG